MQQKTIGADFVASIAVFFVALPLCMAVAIASGMPPSAGLITGIVGGLIVGFFQGTPLQVSGPAAGLTVIVLELLRTHGSAKLAVIVLLAGVLQIVGALLRGARLFRAIPPAVISGMLAGIGVIVLAGQFHVMIDDRPAANTLVNLLTIPRAIRKALQFNADLPHEEAALVGALSITILLGWSKLKSRVTTYLPGPLVAVGTVSLLANLLKFPIAYINPPQNLLGTITFPSMITLRQAVGDYHVWLAATGLAVVASAETLLCSVATDRLSLLHKANLNKELLAQGMGNAICGILGALPMTGVIVRTSVNIQAGGRSRLSAILHGAWLLLVVAFAASLLRFVPVASLAAILVYSGIKLMTQQSIAELRKLGRSEVATYFITIAAIVTTNLLTGVMIGLVVGTVTILARLSRCKITLTDNSQNNHTHLKMSGAATFFSVPSLAEALDTVETGRRLTVDYGRLTLLDSAVLQTLRVWADRHVARGGVVDIDWERIDVLFFSKHERLAMASMLPPPMGSASGSE
jgi:MFS superfamily sulfate permease-like transporter